MAFKINGKNDLYESFEEEENKLDIVKSIF